MRLLVRSLRISILAGVGMASGVLLIVLAVRAMASPIRARSSRAPVQLDQLSLRSLVYDRSGKLVECRRVRRYARNQADSPTEEENR